MSDTRPIWERLGLPDRLINCVDPTLDPENPRLHERHAALAKRLKAAGYGIGLKETTEGPYFVATGVTPIAVWYAVDLDLLMMADDPIAFMRSEGADHDQDFIERQQALANHVANVRNAQSA
jgi:hypothetical protein